MMSTPVPDCVVFLNVRVAGFATLVIRPKTDDWSPCVRRGGAPQIHRTSLAPARRARLHLRPHSPTPTGRNGTMAKTSSFDITSSVDLQEVDNALNQARKEVQQRYDFKGATIEIDFDRKAGTLKLLADDDYKLAALVDVLQTRLVRRNVPVRTLTRGVVIPSANTT